MSLESEAMLCEIITGQRFEATRREGEADAAILRGDEKRANELRVGAAHARATADEATRGLAEMVRARWDSPEQREQREMIGRLHAADREAQRELEKAIQDAAQARVAARREAAVAIAEDPDDLPLELW